MKRIKRNIETSAVRVRRIQNAISNNQLPESILCITGIDGSFNIGCRNLCTFLFPDLHQLFERASIAEEEQDDVVISIKKAIVEIYCNSSNLDIISQYIAGWNGVIIHCMNNKDEDDEDFKVKCFISMFTDCRKVGIPYKFGCRTSFQVKKQEFEPMLLEKWPLVQAHAVDEFGGHGFFTMDHEVSDVSNTLEEVLCTMDPLQFENLLFEHTVHFEKLWISMIEKINQSCIVGNLGELTDEELLQPFLAYYHHSTTENSLGVDREAPYILIGRRATEQEIKSGSRKPSKISVMKENGSINHHMIVSCCEARTPVKCVRTYFFQPGNVMNEHGQRMINYLRALQYLYANLVELVDGMILQPSLHRKYAQALKYVDDRLRLNAAEVKDSLLITKTSVELRMTHYDLLGRKTEATSGGITNITIILHRVGSRHMPEEPTISVAFGESFVTSAIQLTKDDGNDVHFDFYTLTANIPRFSSWKVHGLRTQLPPEALKSDYKFGTKLSLLQDVLIVLGEAKSLQSVSATVHIFSQGIEISHPQIGVLQLDCKMIEKFSVHGSISSDGPALLILQLNSTLHYCFPPWILHKHMIVMVVFPQSLAHHELYHSTLPALARATEGHLKRHILEELPPYLQTVYKDLKEMCQTRSTFDSDREKLFSTNRKLRRFMDHLEISSLCSKSIPRHDLEYILGRSTQERDLKVSKDTEGILNQPNQEKGSCKVTFTVLIGLPDCPESGPEAILETLNAKSSENRSWLVVRAPAKIYEKFSPKALKLQLFKVFKQLSKQEQHHKRVILLITGFVSVREVIEAITSIPDPSIASMITIGAVTCCLNASSFSRKLFSVFYEQCSRGYVNHVVLLRASQNDTTSQMEKFIRSCNDNVSVISVARYKAINFSDVEMILSENAFNDRKCLLTRYLTPPARCQTASMNAGNIKQVSVKFYRPLSREKLLSVLKDPVIYMEGEVLFDERRERCTVKWNGRRLHVSDGHVPSFSTPSSKFAHGPDCFFATFFGVNLQDEVVSSIILAARASKKPDLTASDLTSTQCDNIKETLKSDSLPPGWFFSGTQYVCLDGRKQVDHPLFRERVQEVVMDMNQGIAAYNTFLSQFKSDTVLTCNGAELEE